MSKIVLRSEQDIQCMRKPGLLVWRAHEIAASMVAPGVTTGEIDAAIEDFFLRNRAVPLFKGFPGPVPYPAVTCCSVNEEVVHGIPGDRKLVEGDVLSLDTGCKYDGWCGDAANTYAVGKISPEIRLLLDVTSATLDLAIRELGTCKYWSDVATQMADLVQDNDLFVVEDFVGHGIGREMHESPQVPNYATAHFRRYSDFRIQPGLVIAIEPMVNLGTKRVKVMPDHWTQATSDGKPSAHFEHTIGILRSGPRVLTGCPETPAEKEWIQGLN